MVNAYSCSSFQLALYRIIFTFTLRIQFLSFSVCCWNYFKQSALQQISWVAIVLGGYWMGVSCHGAPLGEGLKTMRRNS